MKNYTPSQAQKEAFITQMTQRMAEVAQRLGRGDTGGHPGGNTGGHPLLGHD